MLKDREVSVPLSARERAESRTVSSRKRTNKQIIDTATDSLKGKYEFNNGLSGKYEITRTDLRNLVYEMSKSLKEDKERIILSVRDIIEKGEYVGWSLPDNKHIEAAYFAYYSKDLGKRVYLGMKLLKNEKIYKPYALYDETEFLSKRGRKIEKGTPTI